MRSLTRSKSRRNAILEDMMASCQQYIGGEFLNVFRARCTELLGPAGTWGLDVDPQDPNAVRFRYPPAVTTSLAYVAPQVVLELGTHAEFVPRDRFAIHSFVAEEFPNLVTETHIDVIALFAKRTFWEKATILHAEYHRPAEKPLPGRYSRHYYDVAMLAQGPIRTEALSDLELLAQVVRHKETFYPSAWAQYGCARQGSLRLLPAEARLAALERDYRSMRLMIFGEPPLFATIMDELRRLENDINR